MAPPRKNSRQAKAHPKPRPTAATPKPTTATTPTSTTATPTPTAAIPTPKKRNQGQPKTPATASTDVRVPTAMSIKQTSARIQKKHTGKKAVAAATAAAAAVDVAVAVADAVTPRVPPAATARPVQRNSSAADGAPMDADDGIDDEDSDAHVPSAEGEGYITELFDGLLRDQAPEGATRIRNVIEPLRERYETVVRKLFSVHGVLLLGNNRLGKTFILNILLMLSCVSAATYKSEAFQKGRASLGNSQLEAYEDEMAQDGVGNRTDDDDKAGGRGKGKNKGRKDGGHQEIEIIRLEDKEGRRFTEAERLSQRASTYKVFREHADGDFGKDGNVYISEKNPWNGFILRSATRDSLGTTTAIHNRIRFGYTFQVYLVYQSLDFIRQVLVAVAKKYVDGESVDSISMYRWEQIVGTEIRSVTEEVLRGYIADPSTIPIHADVREVAGRRIIYAGRGEYLDADRWYVQHILQDINGKPHTSKTDDAEAKKQAEEETKKLWRQRVVLEDVITYTPCSVVSNGVEAIDAPGLDDTDPLSKAVLRECEEEASTKTVIAVTDKELGANEVLELQLNKSPFTKRLIEKPAEHRLVFFIYAERNSSPNLHTVMDDDDYKQYNILWQKSEEKSRNSVVKMFDNLVRGMYPGISVTARNAKVDAALASVQFVSGFPLLAASFLLNEPLRQAVIAYRQYKDDSEDFDREVLRRTRGLELFGILQSLVDSQMHAEMMRSMDTLQRVEEIALEEMRESPAPANVGVDMQRAAFFPEAALNQAKRLRMNVLNKGKLSKFAADVNTALRDSEIAQRFDTRWKATWAKCRDDYLRPYAAHAKSDAEARWSALGTRLTRRNAMTLLGRVSKGRHDDLDLLEVVFGKHEEAPVDAIRHFLGDVHAALTSMASDLETQFHALLRVHVTTLFDDEIIAHTEVLLKEFLDESFRVDIREKMDAFVDKGRQYDKLTEAAQHHQWRLSCRKAMEVALKDCMDLVQKADTDEQLRNSVKNVFGKTIERTVRLFWDAIGDKMARHAHVQWVEIAGYESATGRVHGRRAPLMRRSIQLFCGRVWDKGSKGAAAAAEQATGNVADADATQARMAVNAYARSCKVRAHKIIEEIKRMGSAKPDIAAVGQAFVDRQRLNYRQLDLTIAMGTAAASIPPRREARGIALHVEPQELRTYPGLRKQGTLRAPPSSRLCATEAQIRADVAKSGLRLADAAGNGYLFDELVRCVYGEGLSAEQWLAARDNIHLKSLLFQAKAVLRRASSEANFTERTGLPIGDWIGLMRRPDAPFDEMALRLAHQAINECDLAVNIWVGTETDRPNVYQIPSKRQTDKSINIAIIASEDGADHRLPYRHTFRAVLPTSRRSTTHVTAPPTPPMVPARTIKPLTHYAVVLDTSAVMGIKFAELAKAVHDLARSNCAVIAFYAHIAVLDELDSLIKVPRTAREARQRRDTMQRMIDDRLLELIYNAENDEMRMELDLSVESNIRPEFQKRDRSRLNDLQIMNSAMARRDVYPDRTLFWTDDKMMVLEMTGLAGTDRAAGRARVCTLETDGVRRAVEGRDFTRLFNCSSTRSRSVDDRPPTENTGLGASANSGRSTGAHNAHATNGSRRSREYDRDSDEAHAKRPRLEKDADVPLERRSTAPTAAHAQPKGRVLGMDASQSSSTPALTYEQVGRGRTSERTGDADKASRKRARSVERSDAEEDREEGEIDSSCKRNSRDARQSARDARGRGTSDDYRRGSDVGRWKAGGREDSGSRRR